MARVRAAALAVAVAVGTGGAAPATAGIAGPPAERERITVVELRGPNGEPMRSPFTVNERGQVIASMSPVSDLLGAPVLWERGRTTPLAPEGRLGQAVGLSDRGQAVGGWNTDGVSVSDDGAFSWFRGELRALTPEGMRAQAESVNERGLVVGRRWLDNPGGWDIEQTVAWDRQGRLVAIAPDRTTATGAVNERGEVPLAVADPERPVQRGAAIWRVGGGLTELGSLGGDPARTYVALLNDAGHAAGSAETVDGDMAPFIWRDGEMVPLGAIGESSYAIALNNRDQIVGVYYDGSHQGEDAFLWDDGRTIDLGSLGGGYTYPYAMNNRGQVVGASSTADGEEHAFLWEDGRMTDLGALVGPGLSRAIDINDRGQITGEYGYDRQAVLWEIRPRPGAGDSEGE